MTTDGTDSTDGTAISYFLSVPSVSSVVLFSFLSFPVTRSIYLPTHRPAGFALIRILAKSCKNTFHHGDGLSVAGYRPRNDK